MANNKNKPDILDKEEAYLLLREIENNPQVTQRYLSKKFLISLGKVNFMLQALISKGIIKINNFKNSKDRLAYIYLLTPSGIKAKARLTQSFIKRKTQEYEKLQQEIEGLKKEALVNH